MTMMSLETRKGKSVPVITKALVDLNGPLFQLFKQERKRWALDEYFNNVGPIQFEFPCSPPYLAVPVTGEQLYYSLEKTYNEQPYLPLYGRNLNSLSAKLRERVPQVPPIFKINH